jgi:mono/diheme cytochrome c family protein
MAYSFLHSSPRSAAWRFLVPATLAVIGAGAISVDALAQATARNSWQGVFTQEQAARGQVAYTQHCVSCHGPSLGGADVVPALAGATFASNWNGTSAADLFTRIHDTMPLNDPGSLRAADVLDIEAFIFQTNGFPAGESQMPTTPAALARIKILSNKPAG